MCLFVKSITVSTPTIKSVTLGNTIEVTLHCYPWLIHSVSLHTYISLFAMFPCTSCSHHKYKALFIYWDSQRDINMCTLPMFAQWLFTIQMNTLIMHSLSMNQTKVYNVLWWWKKRVLVSYSTIHIAIISQRTLQLNFVVSCEQKSLVLWPFIWKISIYLIFK